MRSSRRVLIATCLLLGACFQDSTPQVSTYLPLNYQNQALFQTARTCRMLAAAPHNNNYQLVLANAVAYAPYTNADYPLPQGSVVVAEEHGSDPACSSGSVTGFYLMAKQQLGYDSAADDWRWQQLDVNQRLLQDGQLKTCSSSSCHGQPTCNDFLCSHP
jgi:hypothetical protein